MRIKKLSTFAAALGMSLALSVSAFAAGNGSITGVIETAGVDLTGAEVKDADGNVLSADSIKLEIADELQSAYFATEEGTAVKDAITAVNDALVKGEDVDLAKALTDLKVDDDVKAELDNYKFLTDIKNVLLKDQDGNVITDGKNVTVKVDITNAPADKDIAVLKFDKVNGWSLTKAVKSSESASVPFLAAALKVRTLKDVKPATISGTTLSISFEDIDGAAFAVLYLPKNSSDEPSNPTGDFHYAFPAVVALAVVAGAVVVGKKKRA